MRGLLNPESEDLVDEVDIATCVWSLDMYCAQYKFFRASKNEGHH